MATTVTDKKGRTRRLFSPADKGRMAAKSLKEGKKYNPRTNSFDGKALDEKDRAYYKGYLNARRDSADAYRYNQAKKDGTLDSWRAEKKARRARRKNKKTN